MDCAFFFSFIEESFSANRYSSEKRQGFLRCDALEGLSIDLHQITKFIQCFLKEGEGIIVYAVYSWINTGMHQLIQR